MTTSGPERAAPAPSGESDAAVGARTCPECGSADTRVEEDVSDEVVVYGCDACQATWAERGD